MAIIGVSIGISFSVAMVVGPMLAQAPFLDIRGFLCHRSYSPRVGLRAHLAEITQCACSLHHFPVYLAAFAQKPPAATAKRRYFLTTPDFNPYFFLYYPCIGLLFWQQ